jgi:hypothetical protein
MKDRLTDRQEDFHRNKGRWMGRVRMEIYRQRGINSEINRDIYIKTEGDRNKEKEIERQGRDRHADVRTLCSR